MVFVLSGLLWAFALVVLLRVLIIGWATPHRPSARRWWLLAAMIAIGVPLLFRPHELVLSGQDPGVYVNAAGAFAQHQSLLFPDPLLAAVPRPDRFDFLLGHWGYGNTKDSCLDIKDLDAAVIGPRFPPFFSILLSPLIRQCLPGLGLYVSALFALFTVVVLFITMPRLLRHPWAGVLAAAFYLATPLVIWHVRAPRPEVVAGFLILTGCALLHHAWEAPTWRRWHDLALAGACFALAPFFHVTAWFCVVGMGTVMLAWLATGRTDGLLVLLIALIGGLGYAAQSIAVADQYGLAPRLQPWLNRPGVMILFVSGALAVPIAAAWIGSVRAARREAAVGVRRGEAPAPVARGLRILAALAIAALVAWGFWGTEPLARRNPVNYGSHYLHLTDLRLVPVYLSRSIAALALAGVLLMALSRRAGQRERLAFLACILPGALLVGNMQDLFMTRYLLPALCPLAAAGLAMLLTSIPADSPTRRRVIAAAALATLLLLLHNRRPMIAATEYHGLHRFMAGFAAPVRDADGILLVEYARLGAPLEHLFGVKLLSLDNETRCDYSRALTDWDRIMTQRPDQPGFFLTPFPPPVSDRFTFTEVHSNALEFVRLQPGRYALPREPTKGRLELHLYRMERAAPPPDLPYTRPLDSSNMALFGFTSPRDAGWRIQGVALTAGPARMLRFVSELNLRTDDRLLLMVHRAGPDRRDRAPLRPDDVTAPPLAPSWTPLRDGWGLVELRADTPQRLRDLALAVESDVIVCNAWHVSGDDVFAMGMADAAPAQAVRAATRGAISPARVLAPVPRTGRAYLALLVAPVDSGVTDQSITLRAGDVRLGRSPVLGLLWDWQVWVLDSEALGGGFRWLTLESLVPGRLATLGDLLNPAVKVAGVAVTPAATTFPMVQP